MTPATVYVQRDAQGAIIGVYANPQPQEDGSLLTDPRPVPSGDPAIVAFLQPKEAVDDLTAIKADIAVIKARLGL